MWQHIVLLLYKVQFLYKKGDFFAILCVWYVESIELLGLRKESINFSLYYIIVKYTYIYYSQYHTNYIPGHQYFSPEFSDSIYENDIFPRENYWFWVLYIYIYCISLLDNAPNLIVGCIIQMRMTYIIPPRSHLNPPIQHMSNSVPHKTFFDVILTSRYFYDISSFSYVRIALKKVLTISTILSQILEGVLQTGTLKKSLLKLYIYTTTYLY